MKLVTINKLGNWHVGYQPALTALRPFIDRTANESPVTNNKQHATSGFVLQGTADI